MQVTGKEVAEKFIDYLNHRLLLSELVDWAEEAMREWEFEERDFEALRDIVSRPEVLYGRTAAGHEVDIVVETPNGCCPWRSRLLIE